MRKNDETKKIGYIGLLLAFLYGCTAPDEQIKVTTSWDTYTIAVVLPTSYSPSLDTRWKRTAQWAQETIMKAQSNEKKGVRLKIEWYDESKEDMTQLGKLFNYREDIKAIIGPYTSAHAQELGEACERAGKPIVCPCATSSEIVRSFAGEDFFWALSETDISQCEVLLSKAIYYGAETVSLLAPDDIYGQTFLDWFAFQATELHLQVEGIRTYTSENLAETAKAALQGKCDYIICVTGNATPVKTILETRKQLGDKCPKLLFSDGAMDPTLLEWDDLTEGTEGVAMYADPASGFEIAYEEHFGEAPIGAEAQFYDALMLTAFALADAQNNNEENLNESLKRIVAEEGSELITWNEMGMSLEFGAIKQGYYFDITGAGGSLNFDKQTYSNVTETVYCHWCVYDGKLISLDFCSSDGSHRTDATLASWNWQAKQQQTFVDGSTGIEYAPLEERWALLIAGSHGWRNYRHQADVLNMYRILKEDGYDDRHIILIMANDIAYNEKNPQQGEIRVAPDGENLYMDLDIDYCIDSLKPSDISLILAGDSSTHLPKVIHANEHDNVLVFWSGHGTVGQFCWLDESKGFTSTLMAATLSNLALERRYRKLLWLVETCHSSSVLSAINGTTGSLGIAAADVYESSYAELRSQDLGVWMTNRFTHILTSTIVEEPEITYRDLYYKLSRNTLGSHVKVHNAEHYDNLYTSTIADFFTKHEPAL